MKKNFDYKNNILFFGSFVLGLFLSYTVVKIAIENGTMKARTMPEVWILIVLMLITYGILLRVYYKTSWQKLIGNTALESSSKSRFGLMLFLLSIVSIICISIIAQMYW